MDLKKFNIIGGVLGTISLLTFMEEEKFNDDYYNKFKQ